MKLKSKKLFFVSTISLISILISLLDGFFSPSIGYVSYSKNGVGGRIIELDNIYESILYKKQYGKVGTYGLPVTATVNPGYRFNGWGDGTFELKHETYFESYPQSFTATWNIFQNSANLFSIKNNLLTYNENSTQFCLGNYQTFLNNKFRSKQSVYFYTNTNKYILLSNMTDNTGLRNYIAISTLTDVMADIVSLYRDDSYGGIFCLCDLSNSIYMDYNYIGKIKDFSNDSSIFSDFLFKLTNKSLNQEAYESLADLLSFVWLTKSPELFLSGFDLFENNGDFLFLPFCDTAMGFNNTNRSEINDKEIDDIIFNNPICSKFFEDTSFILSYNKKKQEKITKFKEFIMNNLLIELIETYKEDIFENAKLYNIVRYYTSPKNTFETYDDYVNDLDNILQIIYKTIDLI